MKTLHEYSSLTSILEKLIEQENEAIAVYEQMIRETGDSVITPLLDRLVHEKQNHRWLLELELDELNEQFELGEAMV